MVQVILYHCSGDKLPNFLLYVIPLLSPSCERCKPFLLKIAIVDYCCLQSKTEFHNHSLKELLEILSQENIQVPWPPGKQGSENLTLSVYTITLPERLTIDLEHTAVLSIEGCSNISWCGLGLGSGKRKSHQTEGKKVNSPPPPQKDFFKKC